MSPLAPPQPAPMGQPTRARRIVDDICQQVRTGLLCPGDCLRTYRELQAHYGVSQGLLSKALRELESLGVINRQARSGCYVTPAAPNVARDMAAQKTTVPGPGAGTEPSHLLDFNPYSQASTIELFTSDGLPPKLQVWHRLLETFCAAFPTVQVVLHWANEGFETAGFDHRQFDVIHGTPSLLQHLGTDTFLPIHDVTRFGLAMHDLLPPIQRAAERDTPLPGVPFSVMLPCLFRNHDLWDRMGQPDTRATSMSDLVQRLTTLQPACAQLGVDAFHFGSLARAMIYEGALRLRDDLFFDLDRERTKTLVASLARLVADRGTSRIEANEDFLQGHTLLQASFTYFNQDVTATGDLHCDVTPFPVADGALAQAQMLVLGIRRETKALPECIELTRFLLSPPVQRQLAEAGDALPALSAALWEPAVPKALGLKRPDLEALLPHLCLRFAEHDCNSMLDSDLCTLGRLFAERRLDAANVLTQIDIIWERYLATARRQQ